MGVQLTPQQKEAVENRGGSLLVSAAAGSGKTKVLVKRLFRYIIEERKNVTDFLIITYTKAAAAELRLKIAEEITERLAEDIDNAHLRKQMMLVYRADVRTVDSFCTNLLRENIHLVGEREAEHALSPDFRVLDEKEAGLLRLQVLERVLENFYETIEENSGAALLADTIGAGRDDRALQELVLQLYSKVQSHGYPLKWLDEQEESWKNVSFGEGNDVYGKEMTEAAKLQLSYWHKVFSGLCKEMEFDAVLQEKYLPAFQAARDSMSAYITCMEKGWSEAVASNGVFFDKLKAVRGENELKVRAKSLWDLCKKECAKIEKRFSAPVAELRADLEHMAPAMLALLKLTKDFSSAYAAEKLRRNVTDFSDQEHFALQILIDEQGNPTELGKSVSNRYTEIMIDEFQDTNEVQNQIFAAVSKNGQNLFMVGDMKQSIYRFRLADPTIFLEHYQNDPMYYDASEGEERKILLSKNFRSRKEILDASNFICGNIMSSHVGEMEYEEEDALHFGAEYYMDKSGCETEFYLVNHESPEENDMKNAVKCAEMEARFVAKKIRSLLDEPYMVQDGKILRPITQEDIVILMRAPGARRDLYERVLAEEEISCVSEGSEGFFETMEIAVAYAMLQLVDNPRQDVPLISVLRSPVFGFTPDRLAEIRAGSRNGDFYEALEKSKGEDVQRFLTDLNALRAAAPDMSVHRLLWHIYKEWNVLGVFGAMDRGEERRENLLALYEHAKNYEAVGHKGLFSFVNHLRNLLENGEDLVTASSEGGNGVRLMSIHKSKGLEFPVVILTDLNKGFNKNDQMAPVLVHPKMGIGPICVDLEKKIRYNTIAREAIAHRQMLEQKSEEMRVLYVALTRAKEKLILVSGVRGGKNLLKKLIPQAACPAAPEVVENCDSFAQWILLALLCRTEAYDLRRQVDMDVTDVCNEGAAWKVAWVDGQEYQKRKVCQAASLQQKSTEKGESEEEALPISETVLHYQYPYQVEVAAPSKLTATQMKGRLVDQRTSEHAEVKKTAAEYHFPVPVFEKKERKISPTERGTLIHRVMEYLDFEKTGSLAEIREQVMELAAKRFMTQEEAEAVDCQKIETLFASELGQQLKLAFQKGKLWREQRFSLLEDATYFWEDATSDDKVLLQGAIDCFYEAGGELIVVDFKSDRICKNGEEERAKVYRGQLETYSHVLEKIYGKKVSKRILYFFETGIACEV